jgi:hypothetical protein
MMGCWQSFYLFEILPKCEKCSFKIFPFSEKKMPRKKTFFFKTLAHLDSDFSLVAFSEKTI